MPSTINPCRSNRIGVSISFGITASAPPTPPTLRVMILPKVTKLMSYQMREMLFSCQM
jgi:hypothetical protein